MNENDSREKDANKKRTFKLDAFNSQFIYLVIILILAIIIILINTQNWYLWTILAFVIFIFSSFTINREIKHRATRVSELEKSLSKSMKNVFSNFSLPLIYIDNENNIIWKNKVADFIEGGEDVEKIINQFSKNVKGINRTYNIEFKEKNYVVVENNVMEKSDKLRLLCFIDNTDEIVCKNKLKELNLCIGIVVIDNYDETLQGLDEIERANITSRIEKYIRKWVNSFGGVINKLEKDRFIILLYKRCLDEIKENEFEILKSISTISDNTKIPVTISIGISNDEEALYERYKSALSTLDIALGRGGNQAVIRENGKYAFYGDATVRLDKMSKVRSRTIAHALQDLMEKSNKIYIMGHKNSDIDCIGAAVGLYRIAESLNKQAYVVSDTKYNNSTKAMIDKLKTNKEYENVFLSKDDLKKHDFDNSLLIIVDTHKKSYLAVPELLDEFDKVVLIDHHRRGPEFIDNTIISYHEVYASSTSELVTEILMYCENVDITVLEAEALYAGILIDTKNFTFKTGVRTFEAAAYLKKVGLDISEVKQIFQNNFEMYKYKIDIVRNAEFLNKEIAISVSPIEDIENLSVIAAQAADELLSISEVLASFVLCKIDGVIMISGRSMGDINVQSILEKLGGGGHLTFAGAQLAGKSLQEAKEELINAINEVYIKEKDSE